MRIAVVGAGVSGLAAAYKLAKNGVSVTLYEKEHHLVGHASTITLDDGVRLDLGFLAFNRAAHPNTMELLEELGVEVEASDMSFSVSLDGGEGCEWGTGRGMRSLFAQKRNALSPSFWLMMLDILNFKIHATKYLEEHESNPDLDRHDTLEQFIKSHGYSQLFQTAYLVPICASIWPCSWEVVMSFSAFAVLSFCSNHHLLQLFGRSQWLTVKWQSQQYIDKVKEQLDGRGCHIKTGFMVQSVSSTNRGCTLLGVDGSEEEYDGCIMSVHAPEALRILGPQATCLEKRILGAFGYAYSDIYLHLDEKFMPKNQAAWSAWNFLGHTRSGVCLTYWLNVLQNLRSTNIPFLVTLNPPDVPKNNIHKWSTCRLIPSVAAVKASAELDRIQGKRGIWFCGAYLGNGFHEDGLKAGIASSFSVLGNQCKLLNNPKHMALSLMEAGARLIVNRFLDQYILTGRITIVEHGGSIFSFGGTCEKGCMKATLKVHSPQFYWKIATEADLGLADAYLNGYISFPDKEEGLLDFLKILIANYELRNSFRKNSSRRGWWTPLLLTAGVASAKFFFRHAARHNSLKRACQNISEHYDLGNDFFSLFLDETMTYSCAIFKSGDEDLQVAQLRKIFHLIEKARIDSRHEVLEIGCGWGSLAIEVVQKTGCRYTGITLSENQLQYAQERAKKAGLENQMTFLLADYRQLPHSHTYDRIISCEMIEAVGHEYMEEFFNCCDSLLAEDGLLVVQFTSIPDERYDEYRRSPDFIKEYIFHGVCLPCLGRISAIASASRFSLQHSENIGIHFYQTLMYWRRNFILNQSQILALGFDKKFIRTWEYFFMYCAAGFRLQALACYQIAFTRRRNLKALVDPCTNGFHQPRPLVTDMKLHTL